MILDDPVFKISKWLYLEYYEVRFNLYTDVYWNQTYAPYTLKIGEQTGKMHQGQSIVRHNQL